MFLEICPGNRRNKATLEKIILDKVAPGSMVITYFENQVCRLIYFNLYR